MKSSIESVCAAKSQRVEARTLRLVPQADLASFDPIWSGAYVVRNASAMVWETLYGLDHKLVPQSKMVETEEVSPDGLTWTFRLRPELKFHDASRYSGKTRWRASTAGPSAIVGERSSAKIASNLTNSPPPTTAPSAGL